MTDQRSHRRPISVVADDVGGYNAGIEQAIEESAPFIWLTSANAAVDGSVLSAVLQTSDVDPDLGIIGCRVLQSSTELDRIESIGGSIDRVRWGTLSPHRSDHLDREVRDTDLLDVDWVSAAALLVRTELAQRIGGLDERFGLHHAVADYCVGAHRSGWRVAVDPTARVRDLRADRTRLPTADDLYRITRDRVLFGVKNFSATVDDVVSEARVELTKDIERLQTDAPPIRRSLDDLFRRAVADARRGYFGPLTEFELPLFATDQVSESDLEAHLSDQLRATRRAATTDFTRLLDQIVERRHRDGAEISAIAPGVASSMHVAAVVLSYRQVDDTLRCVRALRQHGPRDLHILVVDNEADGPGPDELRAQLPDGVEFLVSGGNLGYAAGNNLGIRRVLDGNPDYVWVLNPDTVAMPNTLPGLLDAAAQNPDAGIIGCRMLRGGTKPTRIDSNGGTVDAGSWGATPQLDVSYFDAELPDTGSRDVDWISGANLLIRPALIDDIGLFPEDYFLYFEETEYCLRARRAGWRNIVTQNARMWHYRRSATDPPTAGYSYYMARNRIVFGVRNFGASVDDVTEAMSDEIARRRSAVERRAPRSVGAYDEVIRTAVEDARAGRMGRRPEIEAIQFDVDPTSGQTEVRRLQLAIERVREATTRDLTRLLDRLS